MKNTRKRRAIFVLICALIQRLNDGLARAEPLTPLATTVEASGNAIGGPDNAVDSDYDSFADTGPSCWASPAGANQFLKLELAKEMTINTFVFVTREDYESDVEDLGDKILRVGSVDSTTNAECATFTDSGIYECGATGIFVHVT